MGVYTTPAQLTKAQELRFQRVLGAAGDVHREMALGGFKDFLQATSGRISTKQLRSMGHPFAARRMDAPKDPFRFKSSARKGQFTGSEKSGGGVKALPINKQTGRLRKGIRLWGPKGKTKDYELFSDAPYAKYVLAPDGTDLMVPRGLLGPKGPSGTGFLRQRHAARSSALVNVVRQIQRKQ